MSSSSALEIDFMNSRILSQSTTYELLRSWVTFKLCSIPYFVRHAPSLLSLGNTASRPFTSWLMKQTFFGQFVGAEDIMSVKKVVEKLRDRGVNSILDYAAEDEVPFESAASKGLQARLYRYQNEDLCDQHLQQFLHSIDAAAQAQSTGANADGVVTAFAAIKLSALVDPQILEKMSDGSSLSKKEEEMANKMKERLSLIVERASSSKVRLLIDAEQTYLQTAIDALCLDLMRVHNKTQALIFHTFQAYRKDCLHRLQDGIAMANKHGFKMGVKLVRGAYLVIERERATKLGIDSPVWGELEETHSSFDACLETLMFHQAYESRLGIKGKSEILIGSHNQQSVEKSLDLMDRLKLERNRVHFAQLYGMGDRLTFALGDCGFSASKYVPFGKIDEVMPYLIRRAQENSSFFASSGPTADLRLVETELKRRLLGIQPRS